MSLILEASRSIFARDGGALLKPVTTRQRRGIGTGEGTDEHGCMLNVCSVRVYTAVIWLLTNPLLLGSSGAARA